MHLRCPRWLHRRLAGRELRETFQPRKDFSLHSLHLSFFYLFDFCFYSDVKFSFVILLFILGVCDIEHERWWLLRLCCGCGLKEMTLLSDIYPDIIVPIFRWHHLERL
jgi:hypothetical protein